MENKKKIEEKSWVGRQFGGDQKIERTKVRKDCLVENEKNVESLEKGRRFGRK